MLDQIGKETGVEEDLKSCFPNEYKKILSLAYYLIMEENNSLSRFSHWHRLHLHPFGKDISSQRSSELFQSITEDQRMTFFKKQGKRRIEKAYWAFDTTSISSYSDKDSKLLFNCKFLPKSATFCSHNLLYIIAMAYIFSMYGRNIIKILKAVDLLSRPQGATNNELAAELKISRRSVFRLLCTLADLGFPLTDKRSEFGGETRHFLLDSYVKKLPNLNMPNISLNTREAFLLYFLLQRDKVFANTEVVSDLVSLRTKLTALLPYDSNKAVSGDTFDSLFAVSPNALKSYSGKEEILDTIFEALQHRKECEVIYHSFSTSTVKRYKIQALKIVEHRGGLYLFIRIPKHDSIRIIAIDRLQSVKLLPYSFTPPDDFDADVLLASAFDITLDDPVKAVIRFSAKEAPYIRERQWAADQKIELQDNGSIILSLTTSGSNDLLRWVLSFGSGAEIIKPAELRERAKLEAQKILAIYEVP